jgi:acid phosphatase type 7
MNRKKNLSLRTLGLLLMAGCTGDLTNQRDPEIAPTSAAAAWDTAFVIAAGDIAGCGKGYNDEATAAIVKRYPKAQVLALGDNAYPEGTAADYSCYNASWGAFKNRTHPVPGNHDYATVGQQAGAPGYYGYFGAAAGDPAKGYYAFNVGAWRIYALNSEVSFSASSAQVRWLKADLAARPTTCILAFWHRPMFTSSAVHPGRQGLKYLWSALQAAGAEIVLSGHNHHYERFAPQTVEGLASSSGIREFVAGGGGHGSLYSFLATPAPNSQKRYRGHGVLLLGLYPGGYTWKHLALPGSTFADAGSGTCSR